ncbi:MAG: flagellar filament capping protein FliD [Defluviitaleaceae bacterium]|nr:flagellar filament capping protein FliD [Defluviitaleaceae bacterium]
MKRAYKQLHNSVKSFAGYDDIILDEYENEKYIIYEVDIMTGSPMRFTGLFSGMDTTSMVNQLMRAESMRMDRLNRRRQHLVWRQEDLRNTMTHLNDWRARNTHANMGALMPPPGSPDPWSTTATAVTNITSGMAATTTHGFSVTSNNNANIGTIDVTVVQTANRDVVRGTQFYREGLTGSPPPFTVRTNETINAFFERYNPIAAGPTGSSSVMINGTNITINADDTIAEFMDRVNRSDAGVRMSFNNIAGQFQLESTSMGVDATVDVGAGDALGFMAHIGLANIDSSAGTVAGSGDFTSRARDAEVVIDGVTINRSSNTFEVEGLTFTIGQAAVGQTFQVDTQRNLDTAMETIRNFVEQYNELVRHLNTLHTTARPRSGQRTFFEPLTDEQRREMSEREIEQWEAQARTGMLHRDNDLRSLQAEMRRWMNEGVRLADGTTLSLHQIGITTGAGSGSDRLIGMLQVDESRLRNALETNAAGVQEMFTRIPDGPTTTNSERNAQMPNIGIAHRLNHIIENATGSTGSLRGRAGMEGGVDATNNRMSQHIQQYDSRIAQMQQWLQRRESHFFAMFARMEQAMAQSQSQMESLWAMSGM